MIKLDILKLRQLQNLQLQNKLINEIYNPDFDINNVPLDDSKTWDLISNCDTLGIFQMESEIAKGIIRKIQPRNLEELSSINAFIRPGTSGLDNYVLSKKDINNKKKYHPILDKILEPTYGSIIYQETIMSLISAMMGISFGKADIIRRALEKPTKSGNVEKVEYFKDNCVRLGMEHGISQEACEQIKQEILDNAGYLFNKSHSIAYSFVTYQLAYLKANYPLVFYASSLTFEDSSKIQSYMSEARMKGINILPPHVLKSKRFCSVEDIAQNSIRAGLNLVKGLGEKSIDGIFALLKNEKGIYTINDYMEKAKNSDGDIKKAANKTALEALIKIGAMEELPLLIPKQYIQNNDDFTINNADNDNVYVHLNRLQQELWFKEYLRLKSNVSENKYAIPTNIVKGKYFAMFDEGELVVENDNTIVIPESRLDMLGFCKEDVESFKNNRKKPKGVFASENVIKLSTETKAFIGAYGNMKDVRINNVYLYLDDLRNFEVSFIPHPLSSKINRIRKFESYPDGYPDAVACGIVLSVITRQTKTGKDYYIATLLSPFEHIKVVFWADVMKKFVAMVQPGEVIKVMGTASHVFGSLTARLVDRVNV